MAFIYLSQFQGQPMITYQTQKKKWIISVLLLAEKSHNSVFLVYGLLTNTRNRYYTLTMVTIGAYLVWKRIWPMLWWWPGFLWARGSCMNELSVKKFPLLVRVPLYKHLLGLLQWWWLMCSPSSHPGGWDPHPLPESPRGKLGTWSFTAFWSQFKDWASCQGHKKICKRVQKSPRWLNPVCPLLGT